jgi:signal peptidase I
MNFALILFLLTSATGLAWLVDKLVLEGRRRERARAAIANFDRQRTATPVAEPAAAGAQREQIEATALREPSWVEYSKAFFPVLLIVFLLRSFLAEPFKIPSSSMRPTLEVGDFILVNKFIYGIRLPILEKKIIPLGDPSAATSSCSATRSIRPRTSSSG